MGSAAGVAKRLLWRYFRDAQELLEYTARSTLAAVPETVAANLDLTAPVPEIIRSAIARAAALRDTRANDLRALREIVQNLRHADGTPRLGIEDYEQTYTLQPALFRRGQDEGTLRPIETRILAVTYMGTIDALRLPRPPLRHRQDGIRRDRRRHSPRRHHDTRTAADHAGQSHAPPMRTASQCGHALGRAGELLLPARAAGAVAEGSPACQSHSRAATPPLAGGEYGMNGHPQAFAATLREVLPDR